MISEEKISWKSETPFIFVLIGFIILFWLPALLDWLPIMGDDFIYHHFPIKMLYSRSLQQGTLPWWDPHTFCGAWPIIQRFDGGPYYLPDYPFLLITSFSRLNQAALLTVKVPLMLHYIWMTLTAYLLGRLGIGLNRIGSAVFSVAYTMCPAVNYLAFAASIVTLYSWLPSICLCLLVFIRAGRIRCIALGAGALALQLSAGAPGHLVRIWTIIAFLFAGVAVKLIIEHKWQNLARLVFGGAAIAVLGIMLASPVWLGLLEGYRNLSFSGVVTFDKVAGGDYSLQPAYLATLLVPNLFGSWIGLHEWGIARQVLFDQSNLLGGMLVVFLVISGIIAARRSPGASERFWVLLSAIGVIFSLFIVLGRHTPVFRWFYAIFPPFRSPYAVRWRDFENFFMAIFAGASTSLLASPGFRAGAVSRKAIWCYLFFVAVIITLVGISPLHFKGVWYYTGIKQAIVSGSFPDLIKSIVPYISFCLLIFIVMVLNSRYRLRVLIAGVLIELVLWGGLALYLHQDWYGYDPLITHYDRFSETPLMKVVNLNPFKEKNGVARLYRTAFYRSRLANSSWLTGGLSLFGYDAKPLISRFDNAMRYIGEGDLPYEMVIEKWDTSLLSNMSVTRAVVEAEQIDPEIIHPEFKDIRHSVKTDGEKALLADHPMIVDVPGALPRVFTQDRLHPAEEADQLHDIIYRDLREIVIVDTGDEKLNELLSLHRWNLTTEAQDGIRPEDLRHFHELQESNRVVKCDFANPNRVTIEIDINQPAMLVMTDVWHPDWQVSVDDKPAELLRVNYLQRGIWLERGRHKVVMSFFPRSWKYGRWATIAGVLIVLLLFVFGKRKDIHKHSVLPINS